VHRAPFNVLCRVQGAGCCVQECQCKVLVLVLVLGAG